MAPQRPERHQSSVLPSDLAALAHTHCRDIARVRNCSWPRPGSAVYCVISGDGRAFYAKQHHTSLLHQREVHAYRHWIPALGTGHAPVLLAADEQTRCVLLSELPGRPLGPDRLESTLARTVYLRAGTLLRSFHEAEPPDTSHPPSPAPPWPRNGSQASRGCSAVQMRSWFWAWRQTSTL